MVRQENAWQIELTDPLKGRIAKPRKKGITMVLDKGLGLIALKDLLDIASAYIDYIKFSFGSSLLYPPTILKEKIKLARKAGVDVFPGGTLFEIALSQNRLSDFFYKAKQLNFTAIEISNGTIDFTSQLRKKSINRAKSLGFKVLTEVGKKDGDKPLTVEEMKRQIAEDIANGADKIIIEGRESGKGVSIYEKDGSLKLSMLKAILNMVENREELLIWEAPLKKQQVKLITELGPNVNLGNINTGEILALESLRKGLRGDTLAQVII